MRNKELESINHQIDGLVLALEQRKDGYEKILNQLKKEKEGREVYRIIVQYNTCINMLASIKELILPPPN